MAIKLGVEAIRLYFWEAPAKKRVFVLLIHDRIIDYLEKGESGWPEVTRIELQPQIQFSADKQPDAVTLKRMHASAHRNCFVGNSIKTKVDVLERVD